VTKKKNKHQSAPQTTQADSENTLNKQAAQEDTQEENIQEQEASATETSDNIADKITILEQENSDCQDKLMRLAAEFENYKKRMARERESYLKYAEENILKELLPSVDNLERALDHEQNAGDLTIMLEGVELTLKGLLTTINKFGLEAINSKGELFDPNFHEALVMENSDDVPDQHIIKEFEKGYQYKDRLLRAAKVVVSKGKE
jgi:molecular chaperone GrpE